MSLEIVNAVRQKYPTPLGAMHRAFLDEVARELGLGLVQKTTGTFIAYPPPVNGVSQDVVMTRDGRAWDILIDGEGEAKPSFNPIGPIDGSRFVAPAAAVESKSGGTSGAAAGDAATELAKIRMLLERLCSHLGVPLT